MKFLKKIFSKQEEHSVNDLIKAYKELTSHVSDLQVAESEAKIGLVELEKKALVEDVDQVTLEQTRQRAFSFGPKIEAAEQALEDIKAQILQVLPIEKKKRLERLNKEESALQKLLEEQTTELMRSLARAAVFMEIAEGPSADSWLSSFNIPLEVIKRVVDGNRHSFATELEKAKAEIPAYTHGCVLAKLRDLDLEGRKLFRTDFTDDHVNKVLEVGELRWQSL